MTGRSRFAAVPGCSVTPASEGTDGLGDTVEAAAFGSFVLVAGGFDESDVLAQAVKEPPSNAVHKS